MVFNWKSTMLWSVLVLMIVAAGFAPLWLSKDWWFAENPEEDTIQLLDTVGDLVGPIISALAAVLVFIAFREQVKANRILQNQLNLDKAGAIISRIEGYVPKLDEIVKRYLIPYITPAIGKKVGDVIIREIDRSSYADDIQANQKTIATETKIEPLKLTDLEVLSKDLRYLLKVLRLSAIGISKCSSTEINHFLYLYEIYFEVELEVFKFLVSKVNIEEMDAKVHSASISNDIDLVKSEIVSLRKKIS